MKKILLSLAFLLSLALLQAQSRYLPLGSTKDTIEVKNQLIVDSGARVKNLTTKPLDTTTYKLAILDAAGNIGKMNWQVPGTSGVPFADNVALFKNNSDATKKISFDLSAITTATTRAWAYPDFNGTFAATNHAQTFTGAQDFTGATTTVANQTALDNSTKAANTGYVDAAVAAAAAGSAHTIYSATAAGSTVSNSTSTESLMGSGTGSQTIAANTLHAGSIIRLYAIVNYSTTSSTQTMTLSIVNTTNTVSSSAFTLPASSSNEKIIIEVTCKITAIGSSGSMTCVGTATVTSASGATTTYSVAIPAGLFASTINTTVNQTFDLTAAWSTANVSNSFTPLAMGYIESL